MKLSRQGCSRTVIGTSERGFFRALVNENGFYPKDSKVIIEEIENYGDIAMKGSKNGSSAIVSIRIKTEESAPINAQKIQLNGEVVANVSVDVLVDTGAVQEIVQACLAEAQRLLTVPDIKELFKNRHSIAENIYRAEQRKINKKTVTYGLVDDKFFISPILQEYAASDAIICITSKNGKIVDISIEKGAVSPKILNKLIQQQVE
ncbi:hypothetical protein NEIRO03_0899 [Nematocida sp. AWRm78]|nr:hypothetical protein NEIRO02_0967 [Nematocida sp. AWRm79]KAI5183286.1 hypothetical protein NEIRO03_0899 [Nematocida sp. AWRm78]